jgi:hypothetical protein
MLRDVRGLAIAVAAAALAVACSGQPTSKVTASSDGRGQISGIERMRSLGEENLPVANVLYARDRTGGVVGAVHVDGGVFQLDLPPGEYSLMGSIGGGTCGPTSAVVTEGQVVGVDVHCIDPRPTPVR